MDNSSPVSELSNKQSSPEDNITPKELRDWLQFGCWMTLALSPVLYWVNGSAVSQDQSVVRTALVIIASVGVVILRLYHPQDLSLSPGLSLTSRSKKLLSLFCFVLLVGFLGYHTLPPKHTGFLQRVHRDGDGREWKYTLFVPAEYKGDRPYPLLVYLHGYGARGVDGSKSTTDGPGPFIKEREKTFDMLALFPQSETGFWEAATADGQRAMAILEEVIREYAVDRQRLYLTGTSRGGFGVWSLAARYPWKWAAIVPICGGGDPASAAAIKHLPCWCFHGARDNVIKVGQSRRMIQALQATGASPRYTEYRDVGHGCWGRAYATSELWEWLRRQRSEGNLHDEPTTP